MSKFGLEKKLYSAEIRDLGKLCAFSLLTHSLIDSVQHRESSNCAPSNNSRSDSLTGNGQVDQRDFLEMKTQIKMIQETLQLLLVGRTTQLAPDRAPPARSTGWGPQ